MVAMFGVGCLTIACCYAPAFAVAGMVGANETAMLASVVLVSAGCAVLLSLAACRFGLAEARDYGFRRIRVAGVFQWVIVSALVGSVVQATLLADPEPMPPIIANQGKLALFAIIVVGASIQEEMIFRGLLLGVFTGITRRMNPTASGLPGAAILASATLFGAMHLSIGPRTAIAATVLGLLAGIARARTGSIAGAIVVHMAFNGIAFFRTIMNI